MQRNLEAIDWCGGVYSHEWGFAKLLHWLRHNPDKRAALRQRLRTLRHGRRHALRHHRSRQGQAQRLRHGPQMDVESERWGGLRRRSSSPRVDPLLDGIRDKLAGRYAHLRPHRRAPLRRSGRTQLGLRAGIPIPVGAFDAHWDAIGAGCRVGDVVNVIGTSTCIIAMSTTSQPHPRRLRRRPRLRPSQLHRHRGRPLRHRRHLRSHRPPRRHARAGTLAGLERYRAGQTGLLRLTWDNGDRTVLVNPELGGVTLGWNLIHTAQDELFAAIEGTAFHTRIILERMAEHGVPVERVINGGGIPQHNAILNQVYANVLNKPVLVPDGDATSLGSGIFAFLAAGAISSVEQGQSMLCLPHRTFLPQPEAAAVYDRLFALYRAVYFALGTPDAAPAALGAILPELKRIAAEVSSSPKLQPALP